MGFVIRILLLISIVIVSDVFDLVLSYVMGGILMIIILEDEQMIISVNFKFFIIRINFYDMVDNGVNIFIFCELKYCMLVFFLFYIFMFLIYFVGYDCKL